MYGHTNHLTKPTLERRKTLGHLSSINPNMINHFAKQSQTCQLLKILKTICLHWKDTVKSGAISNWTDIKIHVDYREGNIYIYIYV